MVPFRLRFTKRKQRSRLFVVLTEPLFPVVVAQCLNEFAEVAENDPSRVCTASN